MKKIMTIHARLKAGLLTLLVGALACGGDAEAGGASEAGVLVKGGLTGYQRRDLHGGDP